MAERIEHDSMGEVRVPEEALWGAQTERSRTNFVFGERERMPLEIVRAFGVLKKAAALANRELRPEKMTEAKCRAICLAADEVAGGLLDDQFPLVVFQTGSGTQTNMNANEVIARRGSRLAGQENLLHPNDDVNMSQSSNDTFPTAMHIAAVCSLKERLLPELASLIGELRRLEAENGDAVKCGRTHLQDATPIRFSQEISGWRASLERSRGLIEAALPFLCSLALGGTAVGTGLNAPAGFDRLVAEKIAGLTGYPFRTAENKFQSLTSKDELVMAHGALKALAADLWKMANDVRMLASGPRCGLGEIRIPQNEPGSSIMPGKVNPTQCESVTMVAVQVMGNDTAVGLAASQGNFQLNVFMPVLIDNFLRSVRLLSDAMRSFRVHCVSGITADREKMRRNLDASLMNVTALSPEIGYERAAQVAHLAYDENLTLREAAVRLGYLTEEAFDRIYHPEAMC